MSRVLFSGAGLKLSRDLQDLCVAKSLRLAVAESCTGGLLAAHLTAHAGASRFFERGYVTYSNAAKNQELAVPVALIEAEGAVSAQVAEAMAEGCRRAAQVDLAAAITGIAGPDGGSEAKPVGLVFVALAVRDKVTAFERHLFPGDRDAVRIAAVEAALAALLRGAKDL